MATPESSPDKYQAAQNWAKNIEAMKDPGYHIGKIDTQTLNAIEKAGLKIENRKNSKWEGIVALNTDDKMKASVSTDQWKPEEVIGGIWIDKWTKELKVYALKQDGWNNPNAPLRIMSVNRDGTTDYLTFEKKLQQEGQKEWQKETLIKPTEKQKEIVLDNGKTVKLLQDPTNNTYDNYSALIVDGKRYEVKPDSIMRMRDGWTTYSTFQGNWKTLELYQPTPFKKEAKPTITEK